MCCTCYIVYTLNSFSLTDNVKMLPLGRKNGDIISRAIVKTFQQYDRVLKKHFLAVSFLQATALGVIGDILAQGVEKVSKKGFRMLGEGYPGCTLWGWFVPKRTAQVCSQKQIERIG